jgi:hypothetical protein
MSPRGRQFQLAVFLVGRAMSKSVNRYRSGVKNPHREVFVYEGADKLKVAVVDWKRGKVHELVKELPEKKRD